MMNSWSRTKRCWKVDFLLQKWKPGKHRKVPFFEATGLLALRGFKFTELTAIREHQVTAKPVVVWIIGFPFSVQPYCWKISNFQFNFKMGCNDPPTTVAPSIPLTVAFDPASPQKWIKMGPQQTVFFPHRISGPGNFFTHWPMRICWGCWTSPS